MMVWCVGPWSNVCVCVQGPEYDRQVLSWVREKVKEVKDACRDQDIMGGLPWASLDTAGLIPK